MVQNLLWGNLAPRQFTRCIRSSTAAKVPADMTRIRETLACRTHAVFRFVAVSSVIALAFVPASPVMAAVVASDILVSPAAISGLVEGAGFANRTVATFLDSNAPGAVVDYTAAIHWGDGTSSAGTIIGSGGGSFTVMGTHTYADEGTYSHSTDVTYLPLGLLAIGIGQPTAVADAPLSLVSVTPPITFTPGVPLSNILLMAFGDGNPFGPVADFTGLIDWGDGTQSAGAVIAGSPGEFAVEGSHTYSAGGSFPVLIDVSDVGGASLRARTRASSNGVPEPASLALLCLGLAGLGYNRRRKSAARSAP